MEVRPVSKVGQEQGSQPTAEERKLRKLSQEFEAIFLTFLMKSMRKAGPSSELFPQSAGHGIYKDLFDEEIAKATARGKGIGLADVIYRELSRQKPSGHQGPE